MKYEKNIAQVEIIQNIISNIFLFQPAEVVQGSKALLIIFQGRINKNYILV